MAFILTPVLGSLELAARCYLCLVCLHKEIINRIGHTKNIRREMEDPRVYNRKKRVFETSLFIFITLLSSVELNREVLHLTQ